MLGVSNKTVSRWESGGGYPDIPMLIPLARALGVTVDDLLDGEKPIRSLSRADWQSLLSFAFALGGGILFYLLDLFMPMALCYCAYLGCMAYGVYLQKYYAYHSRWFRLANLIMCLAVNLTFVTDVLTSVVAFMLFGSSKAMMGASVQAMLLSERDEVVLLGILAILVCTLLLTAAIQIGVYRWNVGGTLRWREGLSVRIRPILVRPALRRLLPGLVPWLAAAFWLIYESPDLPEVCYGSSSTFFFLCWLIFLAVLGSLPLLRRGHRRWIPVVWCMTALCWGMTGLRIYRIAWSPVTNSFIHYEAGMGSIYQPVGQASWGMPLAAAVLCVLWVLLQCVRFSDVERCVPVSPEEPTEKTEKERIPSE